MFQMYPCIENVGDGSTYSNDVNIMKYREQDVADYAPNHLHVTNWDICVLIISILSHLIDIAFDISLAFHYYRLGQMTYFGVTSLFILFPAVVNTVISIRMYTMDEESMSVSKMFTRKWIIRIFVFLLQLAPVLRYCDSLAYAFKARRAEKNLDHESQAKYYMQMLKEDSDVALLRVFECFLEAAPQQILQISILLVSFGEGTTFQLLHQLGSIVSSLLSMAWSMASYHRSIRFVQQDKDNISWPGTVMQFLWHFMITVSRILSISVIASSFPQWTAMGCAIHLCVMSWWITLLDRSPFCHSQQGHPCCLRFGELLFSIILGFVYIFTYITPGEGRTRNRYILYYTVCFLENVASVSTWAVFASTRLQNTWSFYPLIVGSIVTFIMGIIFMIVYYLYFHPKPLKNNGCPIPPNSTEQVHMDAPL